MPYEHKTTEATIIPAISTFNVSWNEEHQYQVWDFGTGDAELRPYDFARGDRRFVHRFVTEGASVAVAMVKYVEGLVTEDHKTRVIVKTPDDSSTTWTVLEP